MLISEGVCYTDLPVDEARKAVAQLGLNPNKLNFKPEADWLTDRVGMGPGWPFAGQGYSLGMDNPEDDSYNPYEEEDGV